MSDVVHVFSIVVVCVLELVGASIQKSQLPKKPKSTLAMQRTMHDLEPVVFTFVHLFSVVDWNGEASYA